jgi:hypothetical protein
LNGRSDGPASSAYNLTRSRIAESLIESDWPYFLDVDVKTSLDQGEPGNKGDAVRSRLKRNSFMFLLHLDCAAIFRADQSRLLSAW